MTEEIIIPLNYVAIYNFPNALQIFDPPDDLLEPKEAESIFYKLSPPVKLSPTKGGRQESGKAMSGLMKPEPQWVIDSFNGDFILRLLRHHISIGLPHLHNSAG